ncbi:hypothetical protein Tco_0803169 [Tanacetum coccineum]|uniref:Uncharacterized protein n=1 Tax=Tanacetum coccineum TaxID=301880 RepID=A0ABQ5A3L4_9ASTR
MDQDSTHMVAALKVLMLKPGEFEIWRIRIEQYNQMIDYALWEVIENGNTLPRTQTVEGVVTVTPITSAEDKAQRRLKVKARSTLMMEMLDQTFDRLQKLVSHVELLNEKISQEDVYEPKVKGMSSSSSNTQNMAFMSSSNNNSTNDVVNTAHGVSTASTQVNTANIDSLSDAVI